MLEDIKTPSAPKPLESNEKTNTKLDMQDLSTIANDKSPSLSDDVVVDMSKTDEKPLVNDPNAPKVFKDSTVANAKKRRFGFNKKLSKKQMIVISVLALLLFGGGAAFWLTRKHTVQQNEPVAQQTPAPTTEASKLTGLQVDPKINKLPVTGVMIENSIFARPQSGLKDAGVVYEAIAEGGITRFLALFQDTQPSYVGPIRSARPYYLQWLLPFQAGLAHVGGSPDALKSIKSLKVRDLDQFFNSASYTRITARPAPHNVYTSIQKLIDLEKSKGYGSSSFTGFLRKPDAAATTPTAKTIDLTLSGPDYNVHYVYNPKSNSYNRSEGGAKHMDEKSKKQLSPKVVIALVMQYSLASDGHHSVYKTTGTGTAFIFQDGTVTKGTWKKDNAYSQFEFLDSGSKPIALNAGQTWITAVGNKSGVSYKP